jgi:hypothetical protein
VPITLAAAREDLRAVLNESSPSFYADSDLNNWLNEGARDLSRKAKCLQSKKSITTYPGQQNYAAPTDVVMWHRAEYLPQGSINTYPLEYRLYDEMDSVWGVNQQIQQYYPATWTTWAEPPNTYVVLFPVPSSGGTLNIYYYRMANAATSDTANLDTPEGWWDLAVRYATWKALFKSLDPRWKEMRQLYVEMMNDMMAATATYSDMVGQMTYGRPSGPLWQFGGGLGEWA